jgi:phasin family protein
MNSFQATASFPFANADPTKAWAYFTLPSLRVEALLETHRKNAAALTEANQVAFKGLTTLAQRQGDLLKTTVDEYGKFVSDVLAAASFEEKATMQADAARYVYDSTVNRSRELCDIATKANGAAADILSARVTQVFDELKALFAAPAEAPVATSAEPTPVVPAPIVTEPVAQAKEPDRDELDQDEDADAPVKPQRTTKAAPRSSRTASASADRKGRR